MAPNASGLQEMDHQRIMVDNLRVYNQHGLNSIICSPTLNLLLTNIYSMKQLAHSLIIECLLASYIDV